MANCLTLKKSNCKNCYKCIRHCPVKSIRFSANQAHIIGNECILCGQCFVVCPQDAKEIVNETEKAKVLLASGAPVWVSLAPSFIANYDGVGIAPMRAALEKLGFAGVEETAVGATIVKNEYERMLSEDNCDVLISSCCHSVNLLIQKYFPAELPYLADVMSPMLAHCQDIKKRNPGAKCVFIGPCVSKKDEAEYYEGVVDAVLTFEELTKWLEEEGITLEKNIDVTPESRARFFPTTGGILKTMTKDIPGYTYLAIDGVENCIEALRDIESGKIHRCFIEMSACSGSCVGGPVMEKYPSLAGQGLHGGVELRRKSRLRRRAAGPGDSPQALHPDRAQASGPDRHRDRGDTQEDGQAAPGGRAELRLLRIQYLPREGGRDLSGQGGDIDVSSLPQGEGGELLRLHRLATRRMGLSCSTKSSRFSR